jgi:hypothetical protein
MHRVPTRAPAGRDSRLRGPGRRPLPGEEHHGVGIRETESHYKIGREAGRTSPSPRAGQVNELETQMAAKLVTKLDLLWLEVASRSALEVPVHTPQRVHQSIGGPDLLASKSGDPPPLLSRVRPAASKTTPYRSPGLPPRLAS